LTLVWPEFERETEKVSLKKDDGYASIDDTVVTSDGFSYPIKRRLSFVPYGVIIPAL
jgi:hypothetical protein